MRRSYSAATCAIGDLPFRAARKFFSQNKKITRVVCHFCETLTLRPHEVSEFSTFPLRHGACSPPYSPKGGNHMNTQLREHDLHTKKETEREGITVWDQKGLVVLWSDGHCSRFSWAALRQACRCAECRTYREEQDASTESFSTDTRETREEPRQQLH